MWTKKDKIKIWIINILILIVFLSIGVGFYKFYYNAVTSSNLPDWLKFLLLTTK